MHYGWDGQHEAILYGGLGYRYGRHEMSSRTVASSDGIRTNVLQASKVDYSLGPIQVLSKLEKAPRASSRQGE
jgi:hypothetical protein